MSQQPSVRLNIGAGETKIPGFIPIDIKSGGDALNLPYANESVDEVYASHVLEHLHHSKSFAVIKEWVRVLKPGGRIRVAIPDFDKVLRQHLSDPETYGSHFLSMWMHGTADDDTDRHRAWITRLDLTTWLRVHGLDEISDFVGEYEDNAKYNLFTLNIGGYKRETRIPHNPTVAMVLSTPRFGPVDTFKSIADACQSLGWKFYHWGGTEWGKGLENVITQVIGECRPDYIFCLDYDSVFDPADCRKMLDFMQQHPEVAAAWPAEAHRHLDTSLGMAPEAAAANLYDFSGEFTEMGSGHFGCTIIRRQVFDTIGHPWFFSFPHPTTGEWKDGLDADISFWRSCFNYGFKVGQVNTVQIGHLEWCVKWMAKRPEGKSGILWQPIQNYRKHGRPTPAVFDGKFWVQKSSESIKPPPSSNGVHKPDPQDAIDRAIGAAKVENIKSHVTEGAMKRCEAVVSDPDEATYYGAGTAEEYGKRLAALAAGQPVRVKPSDFLLPDPPVKTEI